MSDIPDRTSNGGPDLADFPEPYYLVEDAEDQLKAYRRCPVAGERSNERRKHLLRAVQLIGQALEAEKRADAALGLGDGA